MAIVEERCYVLHCQFSPDDYFNLYDRLGRTLQAEALGTPIGYFVSEVGELNAIISLWKYESFEDRRSRRSKLAASPQWHEYLSQVRPMIRSMTNRLLLPVSA